MSDAHRSALNCRAVWETLACAVKLRQTHSTVMQLYWRVQVLHRLAELEIDEPELYAHLDRMGHDLMDPAVAEPKAEKTGGTDA